MKRTITALCAIMTASTAYAVDSVFWKEVGPWKIFVDQSVDYGCYIITRYGSGTVVRTGFDRANAKGYFLIGNPTWKSLEIGKKYNLQFHFDEVPWNAPATAIRMSDDKGSDTYLLVAFSNAEFFTDFSTRQNMRVHYNGVLAANLGLQGSYSAIQELFTCQKKIEESRTTTQTSDPFGNPSPNQFTKPAPMPNAGADPFK
jgi:hypothetical protein